MRTRLLSLLFTIGAVSLFAQADKALNLEDYKEWNRITNTAISPDGQWMTYTYSPNEGDTATFFVREIAGSVVHQTWNAKRIQFSNDSEWLAFLVDPLKKEADALKKQKKPVTSALHLYNLTKQTIDTIADVQSYLFSQASNYLAIKKTASDPEAEHKGSDLIIKDLNTGLSSNIGNVSAYAFNEQGTLLAYLVDADGKSGNGIYLKDLAAHRTWPIHTAAQAYSQLVWHDSGKQLAAHLATPLPGKCSALTPFYGFLIWKPAVRL